MDDIETRLDRVKNLLKDEDFLKGRGLSNEVNIRIFCYQPEEEMAVRYFVNRILKDPTLPCHVVEKNLYQIFLDICEEKRILNRMEDMEKKKGKDVLLQQIQRAVPVQSYVKQICAEGFEMGDVLLLTGVGDVYPFMRIHTLLEALQPAIGNIPLLVMYPGSFDGRHVSLFDRLPPNSYYRAFSVI